MKARNKKTGEVVTNFGISKEFGTASYIDSTNTLRISTVLDGEWEVIDDSEPVDWAAFRREAAKDILVAIISGDKLHYPLSYVESFYVAIQYADDLVKQLKVGQE